MPCEDMLHEKAESFLDTGMVEQARDIYKNITEVAPGDVDAWFMLSVTTAELGFVHEALKYSMRALELKPDDAELHYVTGSQFVAVGKITEALNSCQHAAHLIYLLNVLPGFFFHLIS